MAFSEALARFPFYVLQTNIIGIPRASNKFEEWCLLGRYTVWLL
jgi:hypothetical protein